MRIILDEVSNDSDHTGRQHIGTCGHEPWPLLEQEAMSLAHRNAVLQEKLIGHRFRSPIRRERT
jgi:hypothetical protein